MTISRQSMVSALDDLELDGQLPNVHPGEVLGEEFMKPLGLSARGLAREINVPPNRITEILNGARDVSAVTAILLGDRLGTSPEFWMNLQVAYDLEEARATMRRVA